MAQPGLWTEAAWRVKEGMQGTSQGCLGRAQEWDVNTDENVSIFICLRSWSCSQTHIEHAFIFIHSLSKYVLSIYEGQVLAIPTGNERHHLPF